MSLARTNGGGLSSLIERCDFWRRSPASAGGAPGHKEWNYFCLLNNDLSVVVNLSIMDGFELAPRVPARTEQARVVLLARTRDGRWHGDVETCEPETVALYGGRIEGHLGRTTLEFSDGAYRLSADTPCQTLAVRLVLRPTARPALTRSVPLGAHAMHWFAVPRLAASGEVRVQGSRFPLRECPAYHDHNWGRFAWGEDFAWEWCVLLAAPMTPWSLIYYRITNRDRHHALAQGLLLWRDDRHCRTFRDSEVSIRSVGLLRLGRCLRVPRIMSLALSASAADIPNRLEIEARSGNDALDLTIDLTDGAQIGLPNDGADGMTSISECHGLASTSGHVRGEVVRFEAQAMVEFNRAA